MRYNDASLSFLREKISEIKIALFKSEMSSEISLPNNIIETLSSDDEGNVYFFTSCRGPYAAQIDQPFYACLDYHKKNDDTRLRLSGKAMIIQESNAEVATDNVKMPAAAASLVLVK